MGVTKIEGAPIGEIGMTFIELKSDRRVRRWLGTHLMNAGSWLCGWTFAEEAR